MPPKHNPCLPAPSAVARGPDGNERPDPNPTAQPTPAATEVASTLPDPDDARQEPISHEAIVGMLASWVDIRMEEVDALVKEGRGKVAAVPDQRVLWELFGEFLIEHRVLRHQVAALEKQVAALEKRVRS
jgi:hypothetical protein